MQIAKSICRYYGYDIMVQCIEDTLKLEFNYSTTAHLNDRIRRYECTNHDLAGIAKIIGADHSQFAQTKDQYIWLGAIKMEEKGVKIAMLFPQKHRTLVVGNMPDRQAEIYSSEELSRELVADICSAVAGAYDIYFSRMRLPKESGALLIGVEPSEFGELRKQM